MLPKLLPLFLLLLGTTAAQAQTQNNKGALPQNTVPSSLAANAPPIKMGLWEASITMSAGMNVKTRSCLTAQSYREQLAHMPPGCTLSNLQSSSTSISGDVSCSMPKGVSSSGHFDVQFLDTSTVHMTMNATTTVQGRSMPMTMTSDSHFVSSDCGSIPAGETRDVN